MAVMSLFLRINIHRKVAEIAKEIIFSFAVERTAKEKLYFTSFAS